jgi:hypothetical protein
VGSGIPFSFAKGAQQFRDILSGRLGSFNRKIVFG